MRALVILLCLLWLALPVGAEPVLGTWASPPDGKGQVGHVVMRPCGAALCGVLARAFDRAGQPVITAHVGRTILRDVAADGGGRYHGRAFVPVLGRSVEARLNLSGNTLVVRGCAGAICKAQRWQRVE